MSLEGESHHRLAVLAGAVHAALGTPDLHAEIVAVYVHGSALLDRFHPNSDVDLAALFRRDVPAGRRALLLYDIEMPVAAATGRRVDVRELPDDTYTVFGDLAMRSGTPVWVASTPLHQQWTAMLDRTRPLHYTPAGVRAAIQAAARHDHAAR